ncbi:MAG: hypothetical protein A2487_09190 [Candidatus Raymondbacteria bacterium RifOxyC12_full_50_8]|uniref:Uncharacterized protein n=1 Tax=Candidatus Raymondbacteria bacterium RIFOXYD12_FULL_49_13 TaxID=1817890 RepID=A0A1F7FFC0_UNCRA|nr:MAG: hypothetical protein A2248_22750 [Candidatus Raymondbacteria bacterium RIFOXYA2_FULL_49_16]OGJ94594.1 MAG: hypothetical protein A2350_05920 [Candidatus Raymondbacteria bacterium RifOxyB12_full_50_8]OGJ98864.1 MAG: hypothetical protein A2487_09190 [Candidatus Raymondbacteria bacterium RifOxyC12_full_50_8]OGK05385.1 MAG: hypothetical protein A2519_03700 [Candidatus Raymondbacteria bacterium RIFOXYD12_FULL_49_13]OGP42998.1 MAG: hypothetical protein A2324_16405 [Candidatus Raymondbacteria b
MFIQYYKTGSRREPVRDYLRNLQRKDSEIIAEDLELVASFGIWNAPVETRKLKDKLRQGQGGSKEYSIVL